jgi:uncharacterized protein YjbI with pentapeptide repeats
VELAAALVDGTAAGPFEVSRLSATDSELRSVTLAPAERLAMTLRDTVLRDCDISNQRAEGCSLRRVELHATRALGLNVSELDARDVRITASSMSLASFAYGRIESCVFDSVDLREAVFMQTTLVRVAFLDCDLTGADFRGARLDACRLRRTRLTGILGADSLRGLSMPWADVLDAAGVFAAALGVEIEPE